MQEEEIKKEEQPLDSDQSKPSDPTENKFAELKKQRDEYLNNWKRAAADFINYKKDEIERMAMLGNYATESMIYKILPIFDNFYLAEKQLPEKLKKGEEGTPQSIEWTKGFLQIQNQIEEFLKKEGIEEIKVIGDPLTGSGQVKFNPETMEIVEEVSGGPTSAESASAESGIVVEELQKGYKIGEKVLRPAKVRVVK